MDAGAVDAVVCEHHAYGGAGAAKLGEAVISACQQKVDFKFLYDLQQPIKVSMPAIAYFLRSDANVAFFPALCGVCDSNV